MAELFDDPISLMIIIIGIVGAIITLLVIYARCAVQVPPNKVLVVYGRPRHEEYTFTNLDGKQITTSRAVGYRIILGGTTFVSPMVEKTGWLSLETTILEMKLQDTPTKNGVAVTAELTAQVKLRGDSGGLKAAAENFLDKPKEAVAEVARKIIESRAREALSSLSVEGANADRTATEHRIMEAAVEDLTRLGIQLTTLALKDLRPEGAVREARSDNEIKVGDVVKVIGSSGGVLIVSKNEPDKVEG